MTRTLKHITFSQVLDADAEDWHRINRWFGFLIQHCCLFTRFALKPTVSWPGWNLETPQMSLYSAAVGVWQAALGQELYRTTVQDGQNPLEVISCLQSAHSQLVVGRESISDSVITLLINIKPQQDTSSVIRELRTDNRESWVDNRESRADNREYWRGTQDSQRSTLIKQRFLERHTRTSAEYARHVILTYLNCLAYRTIQTQPNGIVGSFPKDQIYHHCTYTSSDPSDQSLQDRSPPVP